MNLENVQYRYINQKFRYRASTLRATLIWQSQLFVGGLFFAYFYFWKNIQTKELVVSQYIVLVICLFEILYLRIKRPPIRIQQASFLFLINIIISIPLLWQANEKFSLFAHFSPFQAHKICVFAAALLAPPVLWVGVAGIVIVSLAGTIQYLTFSSEVTSHVVGKEPWTIIFSTVYAIIFFLLRFRAAQLENREVRYRIENIIAKHLAKRLINLKDLTNSPLQTLKMNLVILRKKHPAEVKILDRFERSIDRLLEVNMAAQKEEKKYTMIHNSSFNSWKKLNHILKKTG